MKKLLFSALLFSLFLNVFAQVTLTQIPETPLSYLAYEATNPAIKAGYTNRTQYFGTKPIIMEIGKVVQKKYTDFPVYDLFSETYDFIGTGETKATVTRTSAYVAYLIEVREKSPDPFVTYAKDTFFIVGGALASVSEAIYDTEDNSLDSYAKYDITYHVNGKIEHIKLQSDYDGSDLIFAGMHAVYNSNNTLKTDTIYAFGYTGTGDRKVKVSTYQDHTYKSSNVLKIDSTFYHQIGSNPVLNTKFTYTLNANNEILEAIAYTYSSSSKKYENTFHYEFSKDASLGIVSQPNVSTLALYPNPVYDVINIPANCSFQYWSITSIDGTEVKSGTNAGLNKISAAGLKAGMYVLTIQNDEQTWTGKFIK